MTKKRLSLIKEHFTDEAEIWDARALKVIPGYKDMLQAVVNVLQFPAGKKMRVLDIGTGSGMVAYLVKKKFPHAAITCLDMSPKMLEIAKSRMEGFSAVDFVLAEITEYLFPRKFDAVVSSLAMHHLEPDAGKKAFYKKLHRALNPGGIFVNADIILASDPSVQKTYLSVWHEFIAKTFTPQDIRRNYLRYKREDRPNSLVNELDLLKYAGFKYGDVYWKYYNFAVYGAKK